MSECLRMLGRIVSDNGKFVSAEQAKLCRDEILKMENMALKETNEANRQKLKSDELKARMEKLWLDHQNFYALLGWAVANAPEMECEGVGRCDHCVLLSIIEDIQKKTPFTGSKMNQSNEEKILQELYFSEFRIIERHNQHPEGLNFKEWKKAKGFNEASE